MRLLGNVIDEIELNVITRTWNVWGKIVRVPNFVGYIWAPDFESALLSAKVYGRICGECSYFNVSKWKLIFVIF